MIFFQNPIFFYFQDLVLYQQFTPVEMLRYFGQLYKLSGGEIEKRIDFVLRLLSLKQFLQVESKLTQGLGLLEITKKNNVKNICFFFPNQSTPCKSLNSPVVRSAEYHWPLHSSTDLVFSSSTR